jgi:hypothetical protein
MAIPLGGCERFALTFFTGGRSKMSYEFNFRIYEHKGFEAALFSSGKDDSIIGLRWDYEAKNPPAGWFFLKQKEAIPFLQSLWCHEDADKDNINEALKAIALY